MRERIRRPRRSHPPGSGWRMICHAIKMNWCRFRSGGNRYAEQLINVARRKSRRATSSSIGGHVSQRRLWRSMNTLALDRRPGINARARQTKPTEGAGLFRRLANVVGEDPNDSRVRTRTTGLVAPKRGVHAAAFSVPLVDFVCIARAFIPGRSASIEAFIVRHDRPEVRSSHYSINSSVFVMSGRLWSAIVPNRGRPRYRETYGPRLLPPAGFG
jgi:hypothetical protein